jgi:hypothetical protein
MVSGERRFIVVTEDEKEEMRTQFYETKRKTLNICPGFGAIYEIKSEEIEELVREKVLAKGDP